MQTQPDGPAAGVWCQRSSTRQPGPMSRRRPRQWDDGEFQNAPAIDQRRFLDNRPAGWALHRGSPVMQPRANDGTPRAATHEVRSEGFRGAPSRHGMLRSADARAGRTPEPRAQRACRDRHPREGHRIDDNNEADVSRALMVAQGKLDATRVESTTWTTAGACSRPDPRRFREGDSRGKQRRAIAVVRPDVAAYRMPLVRD